MDMTYHSRPTLDREVALFTTVGGRNARYFKTVEAAIAFAKSTSLECRVFDNMDDEEPVYDEWN